MCAPMPLCVTTMWGLDGIGSKRRKFKNPEAVKREAEEDWGRD